MTPTITFSYARQIQPRTGQALNEYLHGLRFRPRPWNVTDRRRFPQAEKVIVPGWMLVVDRDDHLVYEVAMDEFNEENR